MPTTIPTTELDERFSDEEAHATSWDETQRLLDDAELFWISTVRDDGRPHVTPLVAVWHDDALHFCTGSEEQKAVNLVADPQVVLTTGSATWDDGIDVVVEGTAERVTDPATLVALAEAWRTKWDGRWEFTPVPGGFGHEEGGLAHVYAVRPAKVLAFGKGTFSHTRHVFDA